MRLPNTFLAGAQKSGTTFLHRMLATHPDVFFPGRPQEIHFFDDDRAYARGLSWLAAHFRGWQGQKIAAQTSPWYLYAEAVPARIAAVPDLAGAKFLFILRNPADRAYSHYWHEVRKGREALAFEAALAEEPRRLEQDRRTRRWCSYADRGRYAAQIRRYLRHFSRDQILVLLFEWIAQDRVGIRRRCAEFLEIDERAFPPLADAMGAANAARVPRSRGLQRIRRALPGARLPLWSRFLDALNLKDVHYPLMAPETRARLLRELEPDVHDLEQLTGLDLAHWLEPPVDREHDRPRTAAQAVDGSTGGQR